MNYDDNLTLFIENFKRVKNMGWVKSHRKKATGIGKTFEDLVGVEENNLDEPDFGMIEIKSQRALSEAYITLFTKAPKPYRTNAKIREEYGYMDEKFQSNKVLRMRMNNTFEWNKIKSGWDFRLRIDEGDNKIHLEFRKTPTTLNRFCYSNNLGPINGFYEFEDFKKSVKKLNTLAFVTAEKKKMGDDEYFHFSKFKIYSGGLDYNRFITLLKNGTIVYEIRLGLHSNGKNHDHGSGFRISKKKMNDVWNNYLEII